MDAFDFVPNAILTVSIDDNFVSRSILASLRVSTVTDRIVHNAHVPATLTLPWRTNALTRTPPDRGKYVSSTVIRLHFKSNPLSNPTLESRSLVTEYAPYTVLFSSKTDTVSISNEAFFESYLLLMETCPAPTAWSESTRAVTVFQWKREWGL